MIEAIEWSYEKSQSKVSKKERVSLNDWLESAVSDPDNAPKILRPHLMQLQQQANTEQVSSEQMDSTQIEQQPITQNQPPQTQAAPNVNAGAMPPVDGPDIIQRGLSDSDFYQSNRDAIMKQWRAKYGG